MKELRKELEENLTEITDYFEISSVMNFLFSQEKNLYLWQHKGGQTKRVFHFGKIEKFDQLEKTIRYVPSKASGFRFEVSKALYFFSQEKSIAWKAFIKNYSEQMVVCEFPQKLYRVEPDYMEKLQFVEREDEEKYKNMRAVPRKSARAGQQVEIERLNVGKIFTHFLYDLSQGGMAFLVEDPGEYEVGEQIRMLQLDGKEVDRKIDGEVVAIRKQEGSLAEFKVCIKFLESGEK